MPPKKEPVLTEPEHLLLLIASRIDTAIRHMEANPGEDYGHYLGNLSEEIVSQPIPSFIFAFMF